MADNGDDDLTITKHSQTNSNAAFHLRDSHKIEHCSNSFKFLVHTDKFTNLLEEICRCLISCNTSIFSCRKLELNMCVYVDVTNRGRLEPVSSSNSETSHPPPTTRSIDESLSRSAATGLSVSFVTHCRCVT